MHKLLLILAFASLAAGQFTATDRWPILYPANHLTNQSGSNTTLTLNAANLKGAVCGNLITNATGSVTVSTVGLNIRAVTKAGGTNLRVGFQSLDTTAAGQPAKPDGAWLAAGAAYVDLTNANLTANVWNTTGTVGGSLSLAPYQYTCLVVEPESYGGSDSIVIAGPSNQGSTYLAPSGAKYDGSVWTATGAASFSHIITFTDGSVGTLGMIQPYQTATIPNGRNINNTTTLNTGAVSGSEVGIEVTFSKPVIIVGACSYNPAATAAATFDYVLYSGTTSLASVSLSGSYATTFNASSLMCAYWTPQSVAAGTYIAAVKPTSANNVAVGRWQYYGADARKMISGGTNVRTAFRSGGAWNFDDTEIPPIAMLILPASESGSSPTSYPIQ